MPESEAERITTFQRLADQRLEASYRLANAILRDQSEAQDAVHDAVVVAWQRWASLRDRSRFDAWFDRIVVNVSRNRLRDGNHRRTSDLADAHPLGMPDLTAAIHRRLILEQAFDRLKPDDVVVLALRHFLDLELEDIALLLGIPLQTVNSRLRAAKTRLRGLLDSHQEDQVDR